MAATDPSCIGIVVSDSNALVGRVFGDALGEAGFEVVAVCRTAEEMLAAVDANAVDVVVTNILKPKPGMDGIEATALLSSSHPGVAVLILTSFEGHVSLMLSLLAGARGYLAKTASRETVAAAIARLAAGGTCYDAAAVRPFLERTAGDVATLPEPERRLFHMLTAGASPEQIAGTLGSDPRAVDLQIRDVLRRLAAAEQGREHARIVRP